MKKIILILLTTFLFVFANSVFAADLSVTCSASSCDTTPAGAALFNEISFAPGQTITKNIYVSNTSSNDDCSLDLNVKNPKDDGNLDLFSQLFPSKTINMGVIPKSESKTFNWIVTFNSAADNSYQNSQTKFDFDMNFSCGNALGFTPGVLGESTTNTNWWLLLLIFPFLWLLRIILSKMSGNESS